ncbi:MAG TPA: response regulator transcription factor [Vicinamibacterales bacterium]|nr:response regulator transcription factor [Vicinamibacterales bacterium]
MPLRVVLADDHPILREGLRILLERAGIVVVGEAGDGREAVRLARALQPDVVVLDLFMPILNGLDAGVEIFRVRPRIATVLLTVCSKPQPIWAARRAGIDGYVLKTDSIEELIGAIRKVSGGETYMSGAALTISLGTQGSPGDRPANPLTRRDRQVVQLIAEGKKTKEIAALLGLSLKTAESYRNRLMTKLDAHNTAGLVRYAVRQGLIQAVAAWCAVL